MKTLIVCCVFLLPLMVSAQKGLKPMDSQAPASYDPKQYADGKLNPEIPLEIAASTQQVIQTTGQKFNNEQLTNMARKDVNGVASMTAGVQSINGATPQIRGADASGTAYFVDGVRVYGALPILTK